MLLHICHIYVQEPISEFIWNKKLFGIEFSIANARNPAAIQHVNGDEKKRFVVFGEQRKGGG